MRRRVLASLAKSGYTAKDYVQDGLIAMWDGIENAGWGVHDPNATVWKDLGPNGFDLTIKNSYAAFDENALSFDCKDSTDYAAGLSAFDNSNVKAVEIVFVGNGIGTGGGTAGAILSLYDMISVGFASVRTGDNGVGFGAYSENVTGNIILPNNSTTSMSIRRGVLASWNGNTNYINSGVSQGDVVGVLAVGNLYGIKRGGKGKVMSIRMYDREIDPSANYAIDKARFNLPDAA